MHDDLIADILARIRECCPPKAVDKLDLDRIESEVRRDWGGERHYIARVGEDARRLLADRDIRIRRDYHRGERIALLARRWELSVRQIRRIVRGA